MGSDGIQSSKDAAEGSLVGDQRLGRGGSALPRPQEDRPDGHEHHPLPPIAPFAPLAAFSFVMFLRFCCETAVLVITCKYLK